MVDHRIGAKKKLGPPLSIVIVSVNAWLVTTSAGLGPLTETERSAVGVSSVAPPSLAVLFAEFGSKGDVALIVAVFVAVPVLLIVTGMTMLPSDTADPAAPPEAFVQVTVWLTTAQLHPFCDAATEPIV